MVLELANLQSAEEDAGAQGSRRWPGVASDREELCGIEWLGWSD